MVGVKAIVSRFSGCSGLAILILLEATVIGYWANDQILTFIAPNRIAFSLGGGDNTYSQTISRFQLRRVILTVVPTQRSLSVEPRKRSAFQSPLILVGKESRVEGRRKAAAS